MKICSKKKVQKYKQIFSNKMVYNIQKNFKSLKKMLMSFSKQDDLV